MRPTSARDRCQQATALLATCSLIAVSMIFARSASAGTYLMHQCAPGLPAVSSGWSVFANDTLADTVLSDTCSAEGSIGDYVFTAEQPGVVTENGHSGSQVGIQVDVPSSLPEVTIHSIKAEVQGSAVSGDDAWLEFSSAGQSLPGGTELPYGEGSPYTASESWTLPQGARDFEAAVECSTDRSSPSCQFAEPTLVPGLSDITLTLEDNAAPALASVSGPLATAAATNASVAGSQSISFTASDAGSGIREAIMTLNPLDGGSPYAHTFDFSSQCASDSWNACPLSQTISGFTIDTEALANGSYTVSLAITDAAGNVTNDALGSLTVSNPTVADSSLGATPGPGTASPISATVAGTPNGSPASQNAHLELGMHQAISRRYAKRALRLPGRLLDAQGLPIAGATLQVFQRVQGGSLELVGQAQTRTNGTFIATVPAGACRTVEVAYRAFSTESGYATTAALTERVKAGIRLHVTPRRTGSQGTITLSGRVLGPVPPQGVVVELLVHYRGRWEPFRDPRTGAHGRFKVAYQFQGGVGRFPFRAVVLGSQRDFPFAFGESKAMDVSTV